MPGPSQERQKVGTDADIMLQSFQDVFTVLGIGMTQLLNGPWQASQASTPQ